MDHLQAFTFGSPRHTHSGQCFLVLIYWGNLALLILLTRLPFFALFALALSR
jgi:hypothetical protein